MTGMCDFDPVAHRAWLQQQRAEAERAAERERPRHFDRQLTAALAAIKDVTRAEPTDR